MIAVLSAELLKLRKRPAILTSVAVWLALAVIFGYVIPYVTWASLDDAASPQERASALRDLVEALPASVGTTSIGGLPIFAGALAILLGVLVAGSEYVWRTQKIIVTQGPGRTSILLAKATALVLVLLGILTSSFLVDAGAGRAVAGATDRASAWPAAGDLLLALAGGLLIAAVWGTLGVLLGTLLRGTALPIGFGILWALGIETLLRTLSGIPVLGTIERYTPGSAAGSLVGALGSPTLDAGGAPGINDTLSGTTASLVLLAYLVAFVAGALVVSTRRDVE